MPKKCIECDVEFSSYKSWWFHNNKFHTKTYIEDGSHLDESDIHSVTTKEKIDTLNCKKCNKLFTDRHNRWRHEKKCKANEIVPLQNNCDLSSAADAAPLSLPHSRKLSNNSITNNITNMNNEIVTNNGTVAGTINNVQIIAFGMEELESVLSKKEKLRVLHKQYGSIEELVSLAHVSGKYNQFKNIYISSLKSKWAHKYDESMKKFIAIDKGDLLDEILEQRVYDIQQFYEELQYEMSPDKRAAIKDVLQKVFDEKDDEFKDKKKDNIMLVLYNNRELIKPYTR